MNVTTRIKASAALAGVTIALASCGPMSLERAEDACFDRSRLAHQPRGKLNIGASTGGGPYVGGEVTITSDYIQGRDPAALYDACVFRKSGKPPSQPLYSRDDWAN